LLDFGVGKEGGVFDEAAEFFFADVMMRAFARGEVFEGLVLNFQALQVQHVEVLIALIPDLALLQFHCDDYSRCEQDLATAIAESPLSVRM